MIEWLVPVVAVWALHRANILNVDYPLRQLVRWRRGPVRLPHEPKEGLFEGEVARTAERLCAAYPMPRWAEAASRDRYAASLFYLEMLERALRESGAALPEGPLRALDAGPSDWFYAPALYALLARYGLEGPDTAVRELALDGVELDAFRVYASGHSRFDYALAAIEGLPGARFLAQDVRGYLAPVDVAVMMFPFIFYGDLKRWGLPRRQLQPGALLRHVWGLVRPGGVLVIANQGEAERAEQHRLMAEAGIPVRWWARHDSALYDYAPERYVTVAIKP